MQFSWGNLSQGENFKSRLGLCRSHRWLLNNQGIARYLKGYGALVHRIVCIGQSGKKKHWRELMLEKNHSSSFQFFPCFRYIFLFNHVIERLELNKVQQDSSFLFISTDTFQYDPMDLLPCPWQHLRKMAYLSWHVGVLKQWFSCMVESRPI